MEDLYEPKQLTKAMQMIIANSKVEGCTVKLPRGIKKTGWLESFFNSLGAHWDKRCKGFMFKGLPPEYIYELIESYIDWDKLPRR